MNLSAPEKMAGLAILGLALLIAEIRAGAYPFALRRTVRVILAISTLLPYPVGHTTVFIGWPFVAGVFVRKETGGFTDFVNPLLMWLAIAANIFVAARLPDLVAKIYGSRRRSLKT